MAEFGDRVSDARLSGTTSSKDFEMPTEFPFRAVVISQQIDTFIVFVEHENLIQNPDAYFRLPIVEGLDRLPKIRDIIDIGDAKPIAVQYDQNNDPLPPEIAPRRKVTKYMIVSQPLTCSHEEIVAVHEACQRHISVVGCSFKDQPYPFFRSSVSQKFEQSSFLKVQACQLPGTVLEEVNHPDTMAKYYVYRKDFFGRSVDDDGNDVKVYYPNNPVPLTLEEEKHVFRRCQTKAGLKLHECQMFIQQPHVAAYLAEHYRQVEEVKKATLVTDVKSIKRLSDGRVELRFHLNRECSNVLIDSAIEYQWRTGVELCIEHNNLKLGFRRLPAFCTVRSIQSIKGYEKSVTLVSQPRSKDLARVITSHPNEFFKSFFRIAPQMPSWFNVVTAIENGFTNFVMQRQEMFKLYAGRAKAPPKVDIPDKGEPFFVKGNPLDPHQLNFVQCAAANIGWTVAQAPPGCGKTHSVCGLIAKLVLGGETGGICLLAPTNVAVNNGADMVQANFPGINIVREFSYKAEQEAAEETRRIGLRQLARKPLEGEEAESHLKLINATLAAEKRLEEGHGKTKEQLLKLVQLQRQEKQLQQYYLGANKMNIYATTVEILLREGDVFARGAATKEEADQKTIRRLILDEAGQLSPVEALALYCLLPNLTHICLLGDSYQLGPHSRLVKGTAVYNFLSKGEVTRMYCLNSTHKKDLLRIYRCHPQIAHQLLFPIYGDRMECGITEEDRPLAKDKNLLVAEDKSPVVFVDIKGREEGGKNNLEVTVLMRLLLHLIEKNVESNEIQILCFHRAQMDDVRTKLDEKGFAGADGIPFNICTVDSFQGKEAKIVILLTTKTAMENTAMKQKMQFIADPQRATAAVSRAQHLFYVLGDMEALATTQFYARLLPHVGCAGGFVDVNLEPEIWLKDRLLAKYSKEARIEADRVWKEYAAQKLLEYENRLAREQEEALRAALLKMQIEDEDQEAEEEPEVVMIDESNAMVQWSKVDDEEIRKEDLCAEESVSQSVTDDEDEENELEVAVVQGEEPTTDPDEEEEIRRLQEALLVEECVCPPSVEDDKPKFVDDLVTF